MDLFKQAAGLRLSDEVVQEVLCGAEPLLRFVGPAHDELGDLKRRFRDRYESREIPLAEAFDPERGLGAPGPDLQSAVPAGPLLAGLGLGTGQGSRQTGNRDKGSEALANRLLDRGVGQLSNLELDDELLDLLAPLEVDALPDALAIHFELVANSEEAVRRGEYRILFHGGAGPSGARMLGRFCDLAPDLLDAIRSHLRDEEVLVPDDVFAEIVHTPEGRLGNVVRRPHVREVELTYAGHSRRERSRRLNVHDLLLSLKGERFVLRSRVDGKRVRPRLTSAHNFRRSSGMYRFLAALQNDGVCHGFAWNWRLLNDMAFLPRVTRGRSVYALARWKLGRNQPAYAAIGKAETAATRDEALEALIDEVRLPRFVRLRDGDNRLLLDIHNPLCRSVLAYHIARRPSLVLEETLPHDLDGCVVGPEGNYRNEIILPVVRRRAASRDSRDVSVNRRNGFATVARRTFTPGDEWLFFKFYASHGAIDRLLREIVSPLAALHQRVAPGEPWFFVRYSDPEPHLRVRFRGTPEAQRALDDRATGLVRPLVEAGSIHRVSLDTYVREVERYGGDTGIKLTEGWFRHDSVAALRLLDLVEERGDESIRWKAVAMGFDRLLADFGLDHERRERVVAVARDSFGREFRVGPAVRRRLAKRLRVERRDVEALVAGNAGPDARFAEFDGVFRQRSVATAEIVREFRQLAEAGNLECPQDELLRNLTHMHANRLFPASARAQELVLHDFLQRTYRSLVKRAGG